MGEAVFLVRPLTLALRNEVRARCRVAGGGRMDEVRVEAEIAKALLAGWRGLRDADSGEEIPFGPCPACHVNGTATGTAPPTEGATLLEGPQKAACEACGGSGDCRDWAVRNWPDALWSPIYEAGTRFLREEGAQTGN